MNKKVLISPAISRPDPMMITAPSPSRITLYEVEMEKPARNSYSTRPGITFLIFAVNPFW